ncbi:hypothetical protein [Dyadobacter helix]|nr:hypothetical protein [Dyadobacter sp. CECT 9275]
MDDPQFKEGAWVKEKNGTNGMTVIRYLSDGQLLCRYTNAEGVEEEGEFKASDLEVLQN